MLSPEKKKDIREVVSILLRMDKTGMAIMKSNANVLISRQDLEEIKTQNVVTQKGDKQMQTITIKIDVDRNSILGQLDEIERLARKLLYETESVRNQLGGKVTEERSEK